jgi:hypothetical protein
VSIPFKVADPRIPTRLGRLIWRLVERYRLLDYEVAKPALDRNAKENFRLPSGGQPFEFDPNYRGKHLQLEFTVEDQGAFTRPWSATITYARPLFSIPSGWSEFICAENRREHPWERRLTFHTRISQIFEIAPHKPRSIISSPAPTRHRA